MKQPQQVAPPAAELITLVQAREHLKLETEGSPPTHPDDDLVTVLITVAREAAENYTGLVIAQRDFTVVLDEFPAYTIDMQLWPVTAVGSVIYTDQNDATQTVSAANYELDNHTRPASIVSPVEAWPATKVTPNAVIATVTAGFTDGHSPDPYPCPKAIIQAMLLTIGHLYENRQSVVGTQRYELPLGVQSLLTPYRISLGM